MTEQIETETEQVLKEKVEEEDLYHKPSRLVRIALWANTISWVILALTVVTIGVNIYYMALNGIGSFTFVPVLNMLYSLSVGVFFFLTLQALSEGIYILMDIKDDVRK
jgi:hypothetical protein